MVQPADSQSANGVYFDARYQSPPEVVRTGQPFLLLEKSSVFGQPPNQTGLQSVPFPPGLFRNGDALLESLPYEVSRYMFIFA